MLALAFDSARRAKVTTLSGGTVATTVVNGAAFDVNGRLLLNPDAPAGNVVMNVARLDAKGNIYVTASTAASDVFVNGYRYSAAGALVVADAGTVVAMTNGQGFDANGALCTTEL